MTNRRCTQYLIAVAAAASAVALGGCGSSGKSSRTAASVSLQVAFAVCMRSHGVPDFRMGPIFPTRYPKGTRPLSNQPHERAASTLSPAASRMMGYRKAEPALLHHAQCIAASSPNVPRPHDPRHGPINSGRRWHQHKAPASRRRPARAAAHDLRLALCPCREGGLERCRVAGLAAPLAGGREPAVAAGGLADAVLEAFNTHRLVGLGGDRPQRSNVTKGDPRELPSTA